MLMKNGNNKIFFKRDENSSKVTQVCNVGPIFLKNLILKFAHTNARLKISLS